MSTGNCECGHTPGVYMHTNNFASCALCSCKLFKLPAPGAAAPSPKIAMNLKLLDGLVGQYSLAHPDREISRVTLIEFALWYQEKIDKERVK